MFFLPEILFFIFCIYHLLAPFVKKVDLHDSLLKNLKSLKVKRSLGEWEGDGLQIFEAWKDAQFLGLKTSRKISFLIDLFTQVKRFSLKSYFIERGFRLKIFTFLTFSLLLIIALKVHLGSFYFSMPFIKGQSLLLFGGLVTIKLYLNYLSQKKVRSTLYEGDLSPEAMWMIHMYFLEYKGFDERSPSFLIAHWKKSLLFGEAWSNLGNFEVEAWFLERLEEDKERQRKDFEKKSLHEFLLCSILFFFIFSPLFFFGEAHFFGFV